MRKKIKTENVFPRRMLIFKSSLEINAKGPKKIWWNSPKKTEEVSQKNLFSQKFPWDTASALFTPLPKPFHQKPEKFLLKVRKITKKDGFQKHLSPQKVFLDT